MTTPPAPADTVAGTTVSTPVRPAIAAILLAVVVVLWGVNWPVMKVGLADMPPLTFAAARLVLGTLTLFAVAAAMGQLRLPSRHDRSIVLWVGLLQMAGFLLLICLGLMVVPAGRSSILAYTTPLWVVPLAYVFLGERLDRAKAAGLALGLSGIAVMFNPLAIDWNDGRVLLGNGLLMLAALVWAINIVQVRGHRWEGTPLSLGPWQLLVGAAIMVPVALAFESLADVRWSGRLALVLFYNGPICTGFCYWAMVTVTRALPAVTTSLGSLGSPVVGLLASTLFLGEPLTGTNLGGLLLICGGLALVALADKFGKRSS